LTEYLRSGWTLVTWKATGVIMTQTQTGCEGMIL
jgi:hypothetical protein